MVTQRGLINYFLYLLTVVRHCVIIIGDKMEGKEKKAKREGRKKVRVVRRENNPLKYPRMTVRMQPGMLGLIEKETKKSGLTPSGVIKKALDEYLTKREQLEN